MVSMFQQSENLAIQGNLFLKLAVVITVLATTSGCSKPAPAPTIALAVNPTEGGGETLSFTARYSEPNESIEQAGVLINHGATGVGGCYVIYLSSTNSAHLVKDEGISSFQLDPKSDTGVENSQCILDPHGFSVSRDANELTVRAAVRFKRAFGGTKNIYLYADSKDGGKTGVEKKGTWVIP